MAILRAIHFPFKLLLCYFYSFNFANLETRIKFYMESRESCELKAYRIKVNDSVNARSIIVFAVVSAGCSTEYCTRWVLSYN